ncbi:MAG TPA: PqqD family protein [Gemmatimonadales bacterium]
MRFRVNEANVAWRVVEGEGVLLHAETSAYFGLNQTGTRLWSRLAQGPQSADELVEWARRGMTGVPAEAAQEIGAFLTELLERDLVLEAGESDSPPAGDAANTGTSGAAYEPPLVLPFGELEKLILSGE